MAELKPCKCGKIHKIQCETNSHSPTYKVYWACCEDCYMYACANTEQELVNSWNSYVEMELKPNYNESVRGVKMKTYKFVLIMTNLTDKIITKWYVKNVERVDPGKQLNSKP